MGCGMKKGFTLLELVLTIVVMAIGIAALPRIVMMSQRSNEAALKQELIFHAKSEAFMIMRYPWDSRAYYKDGLCTDNKDFDSCKDTSWGDWTANVPIYNIAAKGKNDEFEKDTRNRNGIDTDKKTRLKIAEIIALPDSNTTFKPCAVNNFNSDKCSNGGAKYNDVDDFDGRNYTSKTWLDNEDFLVESNVTVQVRYLSDRLLSGSYLNGEKIEIVFENNSTVTNEPSNIKIITVEARDNNSSYSTSLSAYSFNIGYVAK